MGAKIRIDQWLVKQGIATSRSQAQQIIKDQLVLKNGFPITKATTLISAEDQIEVLPKDRPSYVGRGAEKLKSGLTQLHQEVEPTWYMDIGSSTGGFSDYLLQEGAEGIIAIDVGHFQLHQKLRQDPRVLLLEDTHILDVKALPDQKVVHKAVVDVSFISLRKVILHVWSLLSSPKWCLMLFKPQFEVGPKRVGKGGVVRDMDVIDEAVHAFKAWLKKQLEDVTIEHCLCGLKGKKKGNQEVWILVYRPQTKNFE